MDYNKLAGQLFGHNIPFSTMMELDPSRISSPWEFTAVKTKRTLLFSSIPK
jgi:hypothetical protein